MESFVLIGLGLGTLVALGFILYTIKKSNPNASLGDLINILLLREKVTIFIVGAIVANFAEGLMAASIHPVGEQQVNPLARYLVHTTISLVGIVCMLYLPNLLKVMASEKDASRRKGMYLLALSLLIGAVMFPFLNLLVMAGGLKEVDYLIWMLRFWHPAGGLYSFEQMSYVLQGSVAATFAHFFLMFIDGLFVVTSTHKDVQVNIDPANAGKIEEPRDKAKDIVSKNQAKKEENDLSQAEDSIQFLVRRLGTYESDLESKVKSLYNRFLTLDDGPRIKLSATLAALKADISSFDSLKKDMADDKKSAKEIEFQSKIYKLFADPPSKGGLGQTLKVSNKVQSYLKSKN
jgi:hypothetical protein